MPRTASGKHTRSDGVDSFAEGHFNRNVKAETEGKLSDVLSFRPLSCFVKLLDEKIYMT